MTVKTTVSLTDRHHAYAARKAREGQSGSVSGVVADALELLMQDEAERDAALAAMAEAIRARAATPREEWLEDTDAVFAEARARLTRG